MTIKIRQYKRGGFEVDIRFTYPDGTPFRRRIRAPVESKSAAKRYCTGCEQFYQPAELRGGRCPEHDTRPQDQAVVI